MRKMTANERFFWQHAGFGYDPSKETKAQGKRRCAVELARAEALAKEADCEWEWEDDSDGLPDGEYADGHYWHDLGDGELMPVDQSEACILRLNGRVLASLCGIWDADANYRRVVQAELASEAEDEIAAELALRQGAADSL